MLSLPETPRWLYKNNQIEKAREGLKTIYPADEVGEQLQLLKQSIEEDEANEAAIGNNLITKFRNAMKHPEVRRALAAGVAVQVVQQFVGINSVMYYAPTIMQLAGYASKTVAMGLSLVTTGLNTLGSFISLLVVDLFGRRRLMLVSLVLIVVGLLSLGLVFNISSQNAPHINSYESTHFGNNTICEKYTSNPDSSSWNCMGCLKQKCGFCAASDEFDPGACLDNEKDVGKMCKNEHRVWYDKGCPSKLGLLVVILLAFYIIVYSPGMGTAPWIVNAEIYPLRFRGFGGGVAAMSNWSANLVVSMTFLTLTENLGSWGMFVLYGGFRSLDLSLSTFWFLKPKVCPLKKLRRFYAKVSDHGHLSKLMMMMLNLQNKVHQFTNLCDDNLFFWRKILCDD